ncbi:MAG: polymer-forming cytoskeletal protein [Gammaproteobacteria bacterium]|nr:MAG: polymer-forming cytoskeletal protein [Gammaproteobacteria bacterium]
MTGDINFEGGLHLDGKIEGHINAIADDVSTLTVSKTGEVTGDIRVPNVIINGVVEGNVYATNRLELSHDAKVHGNVYYNLIEMAVGAEVNGKMVKQAKEDVVKESKRQESKKAETNSGASSENLDQMVSDLLPAE